MQEPLSPPYEGFLADAAHLDQLRLHTLRAYRYELALAAADPRFAGDLAALSLADLEAWLARPPASPSTVGRRASPHWATATSTCWGATSSRSPTASHGAPSARCAIRAQSTTMRPTPRSEPYRTFLFQ